jgi:hypothetical protein
VRRDGWTPDRIRLFLETLADGGSITCAARAAGVSARAAYKFGDRAAAFDEALRTALDIACPIQPFASRIFHSSVEIIYRDDMMGRSPVPRTGFGHLGGCSNLPVGERHHFDNLSARFGRSAPRPACQGMARS